MSHHLIVGEKMETVTDFIFAGSKITADGDGSHEIKRRLLLGRKAMTNLDSVLKSREFTLPTKVHIVKAVVFPIVMYRCEIWTIKKAEYWRFDDSKLRCWRRLLGVLDSKEIKAINPKGINSEYPLEELTLKLKLQYFGWLMQSANSMEKFFLVCFCFFFSFIFLCFSFCILTTFSSVRLTNSFIFVRRIS